METVEETVVESPTEEVVEEQPKKLTRKQKVAKRKAMFSLTRYLARKELNKMHNHHHH